MSMQRAQPSLRRGDEPLGGTRLVIGFHPDRVVQVAFIIALVGCLAAGLTGLLRSVLPLWGGGYFVPFALLVTGEGYATEDYLATRPSTTYRSLLRWGEVVLILGILQGLRMAIDPPRFDGLTLCLMVSTILAWRLGAAAADLFSQIDAPLTERSDRHSLAKRLAIWLAVGFLILLALTSVTQPWGVIALHLWATSASGPVSVLLIYGVVAVLVLAYSQYCVSRRRWDDAATVVSPGVRVRWIGLTVGAGALALALAFLTPHQMGRSYAQHVKLCRAGENAVNCHFVGLPKSCGHVFGLPCVRYGWGGLPGGDRHHHTGKTARHRPARTPPSPANRTDVPSQALLLGLLALLLVAGVGIIELARRRRLKPLLRLLTFAVRRVLAWLSIRSRRMRSTVQGISRAQAQRAARSWPASLGRWRSAGPRAQVIRTYVRFTEQASREGVTRRPTHTACQYEAVLAGAVPGATAELHGLTMRFLEARYSRQEIDAGAVHRTLHAAREVRRHLRRKT